MQHSINTRETVLLIGLTGLGSAIAIAAVLLGHSSWLEAASFVTGALCVWLVVKQSIWNFPIGLANVVMYCVVYFQSRLFADAGLQIVYFVLQLIGWYLWRYGGVRHTELKVARASGMELGVLTLLTVASTLGLWQVLYHAGGSAVFWDALTTSISLASQWLLNRKRLENWIGWIIADMIYVPLYLYKELYLTAILYVIFLTMAIMGLRAWRASWLADRSASDAPAPLPAEVV